MRLVIDADSMMYAACHAITGTQSEAMDILDGEDDSLAEFETGLDVEALRLEFMYRVGRVLEAFEIEGALRGWDLKNYTHEIVLTYKKCDPKLRRENFRYDITADAAMHGMSLYKENRKGMKVPDGVNELYVDLSTIEGVIIPDGCEADDYVVYASKQPDTIIAAIDKDVISNSHCTCYNYHEYNLGWVEPLTPEEREDFFWKQCVMGDPSDGIKGVWRSGKVAAQKFVESYKTPKERWKALVKMYKKTGQSEEEALATARCVNMHQYQPDGTIKLWEPPKGEIDG